MPGFLRENIRDLITRSPRIHATLRRKLAHTFLGLDASSWSSYYFDNFFSAFIEPEQAQLLLRNFIEERRTRTCSRIGENPKGELLQRLLTPISRLILVKLLMKQDNMSMAASIESRVPFRDQEFAIGFLGTDN